MFDAGLEVLSIYALVFWHALTVSFVAWLLLPVGLLAKETGRRAVVLVGQVFLLTAAIGGAILAFGAAHGSAEAQPSYVHGMACVFGVASAMTLAWAIGRMLRLAWSARRQAAAS
ncbi:MAG: hypothetical protein AAGF68_08625 [Pseudomonadota bacterium]